MDREAVGKKQDLAAAQMGRDLLTKNLGHLRVGQGEKDKIGPPDGRGRIR